MDVWVCGCLGVWVYVCMDAWPPLSRARCQPCCPSSAAPVYSPQRRLKGKGSDDGEGKGSGEWSVVVGVDLWWWLHNKIRSLLPLTALLRIPKKLVLVGASGRELVMVDASGT